MKRGRRVDSQREIDGISRGLDHRLDVEAAVVAISVDCLLQLADAVLHVAVSDPDGGHLRLPSRRTELRGQAAETGGVPSSGQQRGPLDVAINDVHGRLR